MARAFACCVGDSSSLSRPIVLGERFMRGLFFPTKLGGKRKTGWEMMFDKTYRSYASSKIRKKENVFKIIKRFKEIF